MNGADDLTRARSGGFLIGIGMGGFVDGILFHQILQWHHLFSTVEPPRTLEALQSNVVWDGLFHAFSWTTTVSGLFLLWTGARRTRVLPGALWLLGLLAIGAGTFNLLDGLVSHHLLGIHHVREQGPRLVWDLAFLLSALVLIGLGWFLMRKEDAARDGRSSLGPRP